MYKGVVVILILVVITAGCVGGGSQSGNGGGGGQASVSFTEERLMKPPAPMSIGIKVESVGSYEFMWIEADGVGGGYKMNESSTQPVLYVADNGVTTVGFGICYKESLDAECGTYSGKPKDFNPSVEVYGVKGGEKTLVDKYSLE